jgi:hypothetical protein
LPQAAQAQAQPQAYDIKSHIEVVREGPFDDRTEHALLRATAAIRVGTMVPGSVWSNAQSPGRGTMEFNLRARYPNQGAMNPGGTMDCSYKAEVAYPAQIVAIPGQPVSAAAKPHPPRVIPCRRSSDLIGAPEFELVDVPLACEAAPAVQRNGTGLQYVQRCEQDGWRLTISFTATPVAR